MIRGNSIQYKYDFTSPRREPRAAPRARVVRASAADPGVGTTPALFFLAEPLPNTNKVRMSTTTTVTHPDGTTVTCTTATPPPVPSKLKLVYYDWTGGAEPIRLALHHAGIEFEDCRLADGGRDFVKAGGFLPFGQVPVMEVDGNSQPLFQSRSILRFVARLAPDSGLWPADPVLAARADGTLDQSFDMMIGQSVCDYKKRFGFGLLAEEGNAALLEQAQASINSEVLPRHLGQLQAQLASGGTGWLCGTESPSVADFFMGTELQRLGEKWAERSGGRTFAESFPELGAFVEKFYALGESVAAVAAVIAAATIHSPEGAICI